MSGARPQPAGAPIRAAGWPREDVAPIPAKFPFYSADGAGPLGRWAPQVRSHWPDVAATIPVEKSLLQL